jgi:type IV secretory pathway VirB4 component
MSKAKIKLQIGAMMSLLEAAKKPLLSDIAGQLFPRFFDYDDEELDARIAAIDEKEELSGSDLLELAACYFIIYLKC